MTDLSLIIAPAFMALLQKRFSPLVLAWVSGLSILMVALMVSYYFDLPTGYSIVFFQTVCAILFSVTVRQK